MNYTDYEKKNAARRQAAAAKKINCPTGKKAGGQKSVKDLAKEIQKEALLALRSGDIATYVAKRALLPRQMAQAI